jgi:hypothetical protein
MRTTWYEKGVEKGEELGRRAMSHEQLKHYLARRYQGLWPLRATAERANRLDGELIRRGQSLKDFGLESSSPLSPSEHP